MDAKIFLLLFGLVWWLVVFCFNELLLLCQLLKKIIIKKKKKTSTFLDTLVHVWLCTILQRFLSDFSWVLGTPRFVMQNFLKFCLAKNLHFGGFFRILTIEDFMSVTKTDIDMTQKCTNELEILSAHVEIRENWNRRHLRKLPLLRIYQRCQTCIQGNFWVMLFIFQHLTLICFYSA